MDMEVVERPVKDNLIMIPGQDLLDYVKDVEVIEHPVKDNLIMTHR